MRVSKNCGNCRAVKRRCDKQRPHCGQCVRLREKCPGYRDEWDLMFRDQTGHTIQRNQERSAKREASTQPESNSQQLPTLTLSPNVEELGVNYFLHNFIAGGQSPSRGYLSYVPSVYRSDGEHPTLVASMAAVGLSALAHSTQQPELLQQARAKYAEAIRNVNDALASPVESVKDSTLMAVISMGLFEHVSNSDSWLRHVYGAKALVVQRGKRQFSSMAAIHMFNQVRADIIVACIQAVQPFPEDMRELQEEASKHIDTSSAFWLLGVLASRCVDLLWAVTYKKGNTERAAFLEEAILLQRQLSQVFEVLARQDPYTTVSLDETAGGDSDTIYNGRFDLYETSWSIRVWNNSRMIRIITSEILLYLLKKALANDQAPDIREQLLSKRQETLQILSQMGQDILATVPQTMGTVSRPSELRPASTDLRSHATVTGGYSLVWPLYTVGKSPVSDARTRRWIVRCLHGIRQNAGMETARPLLEEISEMGQAHFLL